MRKTLVALPSGAGVVRDDRGLLVTAGVDDGVEEHLREEDPFHPVVIWIDGSCSVVGGLLPPGAVSAEAVDDRGDRIAATVGEGVYVAALEQPNEGEESLVCCRDAEGNPVRRPRAADYPSVSVTDAEEPCPACGALDWEEYMPTERWRSGSVGPDGTAVPNPVVSCRVCGHEEPEPTFSTMHTQPHEPEAEAARAARLSRVRAQLRKRRWLSGSLTLREVRFPIYAAEGWPARLGGSGSENDQPIEITIRQYDNPDADPYAGDLPRIVVTTKRDPSQFYDTLGQARTTLQNWIPQDADGARWPDASHAAITLWQRARGRARRAAVLDASRSEQIITIGGLPASALMLSAPDDRWVAVTRHADLTIVIAAHDVSPSSLRLEPVADPARELLGPEPPDA
jgi:hypothetical protein